MRSLSQMTTTKFRSVDFQRIPTDEERMANKPITIDQENFVVENLTRGKKTCAE